MITKHLFSLFIIVILLYSCSFPKKLDVNKIDEVKLWALPKGMESPHSITKFSELQLSVRDTTTTDRIFIEKLVNEINQLVPSKESFSVDARVGAILFHEGCAVDSILMGESFGICFNGRLMNDSQSLFALIDSSLYKPFSDDYFYWFPEPKRSQMRLIDKQMSVIIRRENGGEEKNARYDN